jgi:TolB-like protein/lipoprotein NlpI
MEEGTEKSIAVLPFVNMSNDPDQEYFSDGLTQEIILQLSGVHDLLVTSRISAMTFKGTQKKLKDIAEDLNVKYILAGSVRKSNSGVVITAQLIDAHMEKPLWGEKFSGSLQDIFDIQEKVSRSIVEKLKINLTTGEDKLIARRPVENVKAYELYLRAKQQMLTFDSAAIAGAREQLLKALDIAGPNAALYASLGYAYWNFGNIGIDGEVNFGIANDYVQKAKALDPKCPEVQLVLGLLISAVKGDHKNAVKHFRQLLIYRPNDVDALTWTGAVSAVQGRKSLAEPTIERLILIDPMNSLSYVLRGFSDQYQGKLDEAVKDFEKAMEMDPKNALNRFSLITALIYHKPQEAISLFNEHFEKKNNDLFTNLARGLVMAVKKDTVGVRALLSNSRVTGPAKKDFQYSQIVSSMCGLAGMDKECITWLEIAINRGFVNYPYLLKHDPAYVRLRQHEDFQKLLMTIKDDWESFDKDSTPTETLLN